MLDRWHKKEKPVFTGITRGIAGFGFGSADGDDGGGGIISASGGTKITYGAYTIHHFPCPSRTANATDNFVVTGSGTVDVCVIGAGGGGASGDPGAFSGGGGGAGAIVIKLNQSVTAQSYPIVTGHGSERTDSGGNESGTASTALGLTGAGGGAGGNQGSAGTAGGSGGGPSHATDSVIAGSGVPYPGSGPLESPPVGWGNDSGNGSGSYEGGGGGGAGGTGSDRTGGAGLNLSPLFGTSLGVSGVFAGGGGAGYYSGPTASGGSGGGGNSGNDSNGDGIGGTINTGSGGGGADGGTAGADTSFGGGGGGAPGIVIIRYLTS